MMEQQKADISIREYSRFFDTRINILKSWGMNGFAEALTIKKEEIIAEISKQIEEEKRK
jgi:hypothetical protein